MLQSQLFTKTKLKPPKEAESISHKLLVQGDFVDCLASGIFSLLPLGFRVYKKIENIIREEMNKIGGQEVYLPTLQPKSLWMETNRWYTIEPPLFKLKDIHKKELCLGSTHEEVITDLIRKRIRSYKDLPFALYQIQNKFRNEMRATGGLLRVREFVMKDLYSFHVSFSDLDKYYKKAAQAYQNIFRRCGISTIQVEASAGTIGGGESHEFMTLASTGEDKVVICKKCKWSANLEIGKKYKVCPKCKGKLEKYNSIEVGHLFKLGTEYSKKMKANFIDKDGKEKPIISGCYGIGLGRLMATVVEVSHDDKGIIWPKTISPFLVHLLNLQSTNKKVVQLAEKIYNSCKKNNIDILYDNRLVSPGVKLKDCDLIGIPIRLIVSEKTAVKNQVEFKLRKENKVRLVNIDKIINSLKIEKPVVSLSNH